MRYRTRFSAQRFLKNRMVDFCKYATDFRKIATRTIEIVCDFDVMRFPGTNCDFQINAMLLSHPISSKSRPVLERGATLSTER